VNADLEYIGQILEILGIDYSGYCVLLLVCDWMEANYRGRNATVKKDEWGFTMANFGSLVPYGYESLAFPIHYHQMFFSDDEDEPGWKVVMRIEVRGHRVDSEMDDKEDLEIFAMGRDFDFEGLRVASELLETCRDPLPGGRNIELNEVMNSAMEDNVSMFDWT